MNTQSVFKDNIIRWKSECVDQASDSDGVLYVLNSDSTETTIGSVKPLLYLWAANTW